jgi:hypothetical protein
MRSIKIAVLGMTAALLLAHCGLQGAGVASPPPTELSSADRIATRVAEERAVAATLAAEKQASEPTAIVALPTGAPTDRPAPATLAATEAQAAPVATTEVPPPPDTPAPAPPTDTPEPAPPTDIPPPPVAYKDLDFTGSPLPGSTINIDGKEFTVGGGIQIAGVADYRDGVPVVRDKLAIRVFVRVPAEDDKDGAGIEDVAFSIDGEQGDHYERTERTAGYCSFGGGEPDCNLWSPHDDTWPDGAQFLPGSHAVAVTIHLKNTTKTINWNTEIIVEKP